MSLDYDIVVATRNRAAALRLSIPRMLSQSRPPARLILIDASDDPRATLAAIEDAVGSDPRVVVRRSPRGIPTQRNRGLAEVKAPIVMFPDDDSIWFPNTAEETLRVYEHAAAGDVAAVCGVESRRAPEGFLSEPAIGYRMSARDKTMQRIGKWRARWERRFFPDPLAMYGVRQFSRFPLPTELAALGCEPVAWMTGFRMSFRTNVIRAFGFDEALRNYALYEDRDASVRAWAHGAVVSAPKARVYHYRSPEARGDGRTMGAQQLLNLAYLVARHTEPGDPARRALMRFARYKVFIYRFGSRSTYGQARLNGARAALAHLDTFVDLDPADATDAYARALEQCVNAPV